MSYLDHFSPDRVARIHIEVLRLLQVERLYRDADTTARRLAEIIGCDHRAISAAVSLSTGGNFSTLLAKIRIQEACRLLRDEKFASHNLEEIGLLCGFSSRQSFYNAFSKIMGGTPRQYRQRHAS